MPDPIIRNATDADIPAIVERLYAQVPRHLHPAAGRSVFAHLIHMVESGCVICDGPPSVAGRYGVAGECES